MLLNGLLTSSPVESDVIEERFHFDIVLSVNFVEWELWLFSIGNLWELPIFVLKNSITLELAHCVLPPLGV